MVTDGRPRILLPVRFPESSFPPLPDSGFESLNGFAITLLGYWEMAADANAEELSVAQRTQAEAVLYEMAAQFSRAGIPTDIELQYGRDRTANWEFTRQYIEGRDADGLLLTTALGSMRNIYVPVRDARHFDQISTVLSRLDPDQIFALELYHAISTDGDPEAAEQMLASLKERLLPHGFSEADVVLTVEATDKPLHTLAERAQGHNLTILGATERPRQRGDVIGPVGDYLTTETGCSALIAL